MSITHEVFNQVPRFENINLYSQDTPLKDYLQLEGEHWAEEKLKHYGALMGASAWIEKGMQANHLTPVFHSHNQIGERINKVEFHPAYHELLNLGIQNELHALPWLEKRKGRHLCRFGLFYLHAQNEAGTCCPLSMTFASIPPLKKYLSTDFDWLSKISSTGYGLDDQPYFQKTGLTIGMAMTEKQGGTDVRANTTRAVPIDASRKTYEITGHKWFCSAPMSDGFLVLAQTDKGLSCFLLPRWRPDGTLNQMWIQRLKDKLGNRSNASSEIEYHKAYAILLGQEGRGVSVIIDMVSLTRYDCMIGSTALMRRAVSEVIHHIKYRSVMGKLLIDQPLMQNVVADLCLETEAALAMSIRASVCLENEEDSTAQMIKRLLLPVGKYWLTKRSIGLVGEALECLGGNGYVEQSMLPRLYREAPLNAIWEGSGNVQCLDIIRALSKDASIIAPFVSELEEAKGLNSIYDSYLDNLKDQIRSQAITPFYARVFAERLAKVFQAAQLAKKKNAWIFDLFCENRLQMSGQMYGTLNNSSACKKIIDRYSIVINNA